MRIKKKFLEEKIEKFIYAHGLNQPMESFQDKKSSSLMAVYIP